MVPHLDHKKNWDAILNNVTLTAEFTYPCLFRQAFAIIHKLFLELLFLSGVLRKILWNPKLFFRFEGLTIEFIEIPLCNNEIAFEVSFK